MSFDEQGLGFIETTVNESRDFFDVVEEDVEEEITREYIGHYNNAIEATAAALGPPTYRRDEHFDDEFDDEVENDTSLSRWWAAREPWMQTYWEHDRNRMLIELDKQDRELPFTVTCAVERRD